MRKPCQLLFFVQNILSKILGRVVLRRQLVEKLHFSKFRRELCLDANSASGHAEDRPADAHGANRRHQRVPPSTPQDLRRRGAEGAARRNVLRLPWQKRALLATASARGRDRRGAGSKGRAGVAGQAAGSLSPALPPRPCCCLPLPLLALPACSARPLPCPPCSSPLTSLHICPRLHRCNPAGLLRMCFLYSGHLDHA